jgi:hypothetical protein
LQSQRTHGSQNWGQNPIWKQLPKNKLRWENQIKHKTCFSQSRSLEANSDRKIWNK